MADQKIAVFFIHPLPLTMYFGSLKFILLSFFLSSYSFTYSQSPQTDSIVNLSNKLLKQTEGGIHDSVKLRLLGELVEMNMEVRTSQVSGWIQQGVEIAHKNNYTDKELGFRLKELRALNMQGRFSTTLVQANALLPLLDKAGTPRQKVACFMSMGSAHQRMSQYDVAATAFTRARKVAEENSLRDLEIRAAMNLGNLYQFLNQYDEMLQYLLQILTKAEQYNLTEDIPMIRFNISNAEAHLNNFGEAIKYLLDVLPYYQQKNNQYALGLAYANLSWCYFKSQKYPLAIDYAQKSHTIRTAINDKAGLAHLDLNLSKIFLETGQYDSCQQYAQAALEKSIALKLQTDVRDNYETLAMLNERRGNYAAANKYLHKFSDWKDSIYKQEKDEVLEKELIMFKTGAADKMNKELSASKKITGIYQILTLVLAMLLSVFAICTIIRSRKKQEQNHQPVVDDLQEKENDRLHKELHAVQADYKKLEQALHHQQSTDISALRDMISSNKLHSDGYWNEFLLLFSKVYPDFFEKMKSEFPGLNQNDLRICALIKLNHSIPDMAKALNITVDSARKARYRLFKKLELANDQELTNLIIRL